MIRAALGCLLTLRYSATALAASSDSVAERLFEQMLYQTGRRTAPSEARSWHRSLPVIARDLLDAGLSQVEVILEYQLPLTSQRADVVLAGYHPVTGRPSYVVIELKQWAEAHRWQDDDNLINVEGMPGGPKLHPARQVRNYCDYIVDFARTLSGDEDSVAGAAYLHNAIHAERVAELYLAPLDKHGQLFTGAQRGKFHEFLRSRLDGSVSGWSW